MNISEHPCKVYKDERGGLVQVFKRSFIEKYQQDFGQVYFITFNGSSVVRGNHYHLHQEESFCVAVGTVKILLKDMATGESFEKIYTAQEDSMCILSIGENIAHTLISMSDFSLVLCFSTKEYEVENDDKYYYPLA